MSKRRRSAQNKQGGSEFTRVIDEILLKLKTDPDYRIIINELSTETGIERRRLYDLMNVLDACGICSKVFSNTYEYNGENGFENQLITLSKELESQAHEGSLYDLFQLTDSPTIGTLATTLLKIYLYLGTCVLSIRNIALLMAPDVSRSRQILRRLYLVTFLLERIGLLKHDTQVGQYKLLLCDVSRISRDVLNDMSNFQQFRPDSIEFQLNRFDDSFMTSLRQARMTQVVLNIQKKRRSTAQILDDEVDILNIENMQEVS